MPRFDGTGPSGFGPRTGRGFGPCGAQVGFGRRLGCMFGYRKYSEKEEVEMLEQELKAVQERLSELKDQK